LCDARRTELIPFYSPFAAKSSLKWLQLETIMHTITADTSLQQSLVNALGLTEVRAVDGALLGYFSPARRKLAEAYVEAAAHFDQEEMERRKTSNETGRSTTEVLNNLAELGQ
jgi:hypothetical protein